MNDYTIHNTFPNPVTILDYDLLSLIIEQNNTIIKQNNELIELLGRRSKFNESKDE